MKNKSSHTHTHTQPNAKQEKEGANDAGVSCQKPLENCGALRKKRLTNGSLRDE